MRLYYNTINDYNTINVFPVNLYMWMCRLCLQVCQAQQNAHETPFLLLTIYVPIFEKARTHFQ